MPTPMPPCWIKEPVAHGLVTRSARQLHDQVRGLIPWPCASMELDGKNVKVYRTAIGSETTLGCGEDRPRPVSRASTIACGDRTAAAHSASCRPRAASAWRQRTICVGIPYRWTYERYASECSARDTALEVLMQVSRANAWSDGSLKRTIAKNRLDSREAALATRLCLWCASKTAVCWTTISAAVCSQKPNRLEPVILNILRIGGLSDPVHG